MALRTVEADNGSTLLSVDELRAHCARSARSAITTSIRFIC